MPSAATTNKLSDRLRNLKNKAFNIPYIYQTRWPWVDYLKGIAILLVVYRHVIIGIERSEIPIPNALLYANMMFFSFRMPLFFILSGLFISRSLAKRTLSQIVSIKFEKLLYPYFIWTFIQVTIQIILSGYWGKQSSNSYINTHRDLTDYLYIFYHPQRIDQFWYFPALFNVTIIYLFIKTKLKPPLWLNAAFGVFLFFAAPPYSDYSMLFDWMHFYMYFILGDAISAFLLKENAIKLLQRNIVFLAVLPLFILSQTYYLSNSDKIANWQLLPVVLIGCLMMLIISFRLQKWNIMLFLRVLGFHSIYVYVMHVMISALVRIILTRIFLISDPVILLLSGILAGAVIPIIVYNFFLKEKMWFLFSYKRPQTASVGSGVGDGSATSTSPAS